MEKNYLLRGTFLAFLLLFAGFTALAQTGSINGTVYDEARLPLSGANVKIESINRNVTTDANGKYVISGLSAGTYNITVSYLGLTSVQRAVAVGSEAVTANFNFESKSTDIDEVVFIGYGTQRKSVVTGAISKINSSDLENKPVMRVEQSLQGRISGITVTTNSGQPGEGATLRIRGTTSINNSEPLYIVDGVQIGGGIDYLNQSDIATMEVLKDAASGAIYGARAASGVVIITTKKGSTDGIRVNYNAYAGTQEPSRQLNLLNATQYAALYNEAQLGANPSATVRFPNPSQYGVGTNWQDAVFNNSAMLQNHELSLSGGSQKSQYYGSFGYWDQEGIVASNNSKYTRFTARFNSSHEITKSIKFGQTISYARVNNVGVATNTEYGSPLSRAINMDPITPLIETDPAKIGPGSIYATNPVVRNSSGFPYGISEYAQSEILNPVAALAVAQGNSWSDKVVGNIFVEAEILKGLKVRSTGGFDLAFWGGHSFQPIFYLNSINKTDITAYNRNINRGLFWQLENTVSYNKQIEKHNFSLLAGYGAQKNKGETQGGSKEQIPATNLKEASLQFSVPRIDDSFYGGEYLNTLNSVFGRVTYDFDEKYLFMGIIRRDGSSRFGPNNKYGYFPSASVGWVASKEDFFPQSNAVNFLKFRGSYGVTGNDNIGDFRYLSTVSGGRNYTLGSSAGLVIGVSPDALSNPDLKWEQTAQTNIGVDAILFKNFTLTAEWFNKKTSGMLIQVDVPGYVGNTGPIGNVADLTNKGVELELGFRQQFGELSFNASANGSFIKNRIVYLGDDKTFLGGQTITPQGLQVTRTQVGYAIGSFYGFRADGIFQNTAEIAAYTNSAGAPIQPNAKPGDIRFRDLNNDGIINEDDREIIGDPTPNFTYGITLGASYKGFDFYMLGTGVTGNQIFNGLRRFDLPTANYTTDILNRWRGEGTSNTMPRLTTQDDNKNYSRVSSIFLQDGTYFRIKVLQVGYTFKSDLTKKVGLDKVRFYLMANNLLTLTKYKGYDPEIGGGSYGVDRGFYPQARSFFAGVNVGF